MELIDETSSPHNSAAASTDLGNAVWVYTPHDGYCFNSGFLTTMFTFFCRMVWPFCCIDTVDYSLVEANDGRLYDHI